jgi:phosphohistidine phosphatase
MPGIGPFRQAGKTICVSYEGVPSMTLKLILCRHAKSSWDDQSIDDHDRPLNKRGRAGAEEIGEWLAQHDHQPDLVLSSTSARTCETWDIMAKVLSGPVEVSKDRALYLASPEDLMRKLHGVKGAKTVMIVGHNPGIGLFAGALAAHAPHHPRFAHYPTCATTVMQFSEADWSKVIWNSGDVLGFEVPASEA